MQLLLKDAYDFVRSRIDELSQTASDMLLDSIDDRNLEETVRQMLPEAIQRVVLDAPVQILEANSEFGGTAGADSPGGIVETNVVDGVFYFAVVGGDPLLRLVYFRVEDSKVVLTESVPEDSPKGRMQLNDYVKGRPDAPVLVLPQGSDTNYPSYEYFTTKLDAPYYRIGFVKIPVVETDIISSNPYYDVGAKIHLPVLNQLTAMVLTAYGSQAAQYYFQLATTYLRP